MVTASRALRLLLVLLCFAPVAAQAGKLTIKGDPQLGFEVSGDRVRVTGTFVMANGGDEIARMVFPGIELAGWSYAGKPVDLNPNQSFTWEIKEEFPLEKLSCGADPHGQCGGLNLPSKGTFPLYVMRYYQDENGKQFSAPAVFSVQIGPLSQEEQQRVLIPQLDVEGKVESEFPFFSSRGFDWRGEEQEFHFAIRLKSRSASPLQVAVSNHLSKELQSEFAPQAITVEGSPPGSGLKEVVVNAVVKNVSALPGSTYSSFWVAQHENAGVRVTRLMNITVPITTADRLPAVIGVAVALMVGLGMAMYWVIFRSAPKTKA